MSMARQAKTDGAGCVNDPVRSITAFDVLTAQPDDSVVVLAQLMKEFRCGALLVENGDHPPGIVSERDVLWAIADGNDQVVANDLATSEPLWISADAEIGDAAEMLVIAKVRHLVVEDGDRYGIISVRDLIEPLLESALP